MNSLGRISLLLGALVLLVFGVVCLKQQLSPGHSPPDFVSPGAVEAAGDRQTTAIRQPTILPTESAQDRDLRFNHQHELSPVSVEEAPLEPVTIPAQPNLPVFHRSYSPVENDFHHAAPLSSGDSPAVSSALLVTPAEEDISSQRLSSESIPASVVTRTDDSLWSISERLYGRGEFYKALFLHNRAILPRPDRIPGGLELSTPAIDELRRLYPEACPAGT